VVAPGNKLPYRDRGPSGTANKVRRGHVSSRRNTPLTPAALRFAPPDPHDLSALLLYVRFVLQRPSQAASE